MRHCLWALLIAALTATQASAQGLGLGAGVGETPRHRAAAATLPGNAASLAPANACWTRRIIASYRGPLLNVQFADATTMDVVQRSDGYPDQSSLWSNAVTHGSGGVTTVRVKTCYDQIASSNWTQATATSQPMLVQDRNGDLGIVYDAYVGTTQFTSRKLVNTTLALTQDTISAYTVVAPRSNNDFAGTNTGVNLFMLGTEGGNALQLVSYFNNGVTRWNDGAGTNGGWISSLPSMAYLVTSTSNRTYGVDGFSGFTKAGDLGATALTGGVLGMNSSATNADNSSPIESLQYGVIVWNSTLSAANQTAVIAAITAMGKTNPTATCNVTMQGESIMAGTKAPGLMAWPQQLQYALPRTAKIFNFGKPSQGIGVGTSNTTDYAATAAMLFNAAAACNIYILNGGNTNDWYNGGGAPSITVAAEQALINTLVASARATGFSPVYVMTPIDITGGASTYTQLAGMLTSILANATANNYVPIRVDQSVLGTYGTSHSDTTYYDTDAIHLNGTGSGVVAGIVESAIAGNFWH